ncbi:ATP-binding cassette domain-containing protein [Clostridium ganghwense]|uniref:ATP-binding cassette domain-containing protein n=1 Tax=Clostridium ganghwense TaxID=312089 RepID=A0ABT4CLX8_9CLOT|nr:ATP-binding cassette domain-containing protein [Clostridium ganghwense]MCY6370060.1 ATP-binding cassette domain-containing protein [Clostridium ganghwense]
MCILEFEKVYFNDGKKNILKDINLKIENRDFISIVGPSGGGKSTLLKLISHLISPTEGSIHYKGNNILEYAPTELRQHCAYCYQNPHLFGNTVLENLSFPYEIRGKEVDFEKIYELLALFKMDKNYINKNVDKLSGGEKQRLALIRTLTFNPEILLLDEITSALDVDNTIIVENIIKELNKKGVTVLWITHNLEQSKKFANKLLTIEEGKIKSLEVLK